MPLVPPFWPLGPGGMPAAMPASPGGGGKPARAPGIGDDGLRQRLVPRDPKADPRSRPHMDHVAAILNSLLRRGQMVQSGDSDWTILPDDGDVRVETGPTGHISDADRGKLIVFNSSAPIYEAIDHASTLADQWLVACVNIGTNDVVITPDSGLINGLRYLRLIERQSCILYSDGVDFWAFLGGAGWVDEHRNTVIGDLAGMSLQ